jgi:hypothetical protein
MKNLIWPFHEFHFCLEQCCGSGRFLIGSGSDFRKRPEPDSDPNKFSVVKTCSKKYLHEPKSLTTEIPEVFWLLHIPKKVRYGHYLMPGPGSGSATLV